MRLIPIVLLQRAGPGNFMQIGISEQQETKYTTRASALQCSFCLSCDIPGKEKERGVKQGKQEIRIITLAEA